MAFAGSTQEQTLGVQPDLKVSGGTLLTADDLYLFNEGSHRQLYNKLGAHLTTMNGVKGTYFAVWAPNAESVSLETYRGDKRQHPLSPRGNSGIWEAFVPGIGSGVLYKYRISSPRQRGFVGEKTDPFAFHTETPPQTASVVWDIHYDWSDQEWMGNRVKKNALDAPQAIYEMHLGSWQRATDPGAPWLSYGEIAPALVDYLNRTGFTHVEFLPLTEHPFYGSWGYQTTGYFAPTSRYGTPQDLMYLIDYLHQHGIGVILDWVPSHFPSDAHGLAFFDGTHLYEHADPRQGFHPDWNSAIFNYGRSEIRSFLISSALFWFDKYHIDGLRVDAVASMLYLDYSRKSGEWIPNAHGGRENLEAIAFLRQMNHAIYESYPDVQTYAEESTAWPMVSRPTYLGGLGFGLKWDMGWMHDTLRYMSVDPIYRKFHQNELTFRQVYAFTENFVMPLSHDEVVHGKGSLINKMPGDKWQKLAGLRTMYGYMYGQPGKKLLFMGDEFGQWAEWNHDSSLDWDLLNDPAHGGLQRWVADLNRTYRDERALHELDADPAGFEWIDCNDAEQSVISFLRKGKTTDELVIVVLNLTPVLRTNYLVGAPRGGSWHEILNSDAHFYGGSGHGNLGQIEAAPFRSYGRPWSLTLTLPPLSAIFLKSNG